MAHEKIPSSPAPEPAPAPVPSSVPPVFQSTYLQGIANAIALRGKAIRYHGELKFSKEATDVGERLNLDFHYIRKYFIRLSIWEDSVFWLNVALPGPRRSGGWAHYHEMEGVLDTLSTDPGVICECFEQTIQSPTEVSAFWPASPR